MTSKEIRQQFLDFFRAKDHEIVDSSPVVPFDDPTLMFANAGMNQFKDVFLGTGSRAYVRAADTQKCIRAGGKHNDLDDVGKDTYHHTFFEMLGNWSFGDYFKKEAIEWAWELLTEVWKIPKDRLHATYFEGDTAEGLEPDSQAAELWRTVTDIDPSHIHPGNKKDNFWEMGETGPCGPCSEIHIDLTPDLSGAPLVNAGDARVIEIWNLVFIQFNRAADRKLSPLPAKHVDTGMGFERICAVLQGMQRGDLGGVTNYDTDVFTPIFDAIRQRTRAPAYTATLPSDDNKPTAAPPLQGGDGGGRGVAPGSNRCDNNQIMIDVSYRVIADHVRCLTFALTDGATPSNEGRGYVLRRILRRAVRYGRQYMNMREPFLYDLVKPLVAHMSDAFPELRTAHGGKNIEHVAEIIRDEEESFGRTFDRGLKLYREAAEDAHKHHHGRISGEAAFKLHDTFGFTIDLTELMAEEDGLTIDLGEYERLMEGAREAARGTKPVVSEKENELNCDTIKRLARSVDEPTGFAGYNHLACQAHVLAIAAEDQQSLYGGVLKAPDRGYIVLDWTSLYVERGGQVGDVGRILGSFGEFAVEKVVDVDGRFIHVGQCVAGSIAQSLMTFVGSTDPEYAAYIATDPARQPLLAIVDSTRRIPTMKNHTATHILNWALRTVLCPKEEWDNPHVQQKGSLVDPEKTRFDFSHSKPLTEDQLEQIETLCNEQIEANLPVYTQEVDQTEARKINTLRAVFGEKYPERVRVVSIGVPIGTEGSDDSNTLLGNPKNPEWMDYSVEFCGGTHVRSSNDVQRFVLISEEGVAKGVRRVVGITGDTAINAVALGESLLSEARSLTLLVEDDASAKRNRKSKKLRRLFRLDVKGKESDKQRRAGMEAVAPPLQGGDGGGIDLPTALSVFQKKLADAVIPLRTRHEIQRILTDLQKLAKTQQKKQAAASGEAVHDAVKTLLDNATCVGGITVVVGEVPPANADALRVAIDWVRNKTDASAVLLATSNEGKVTLIAGMSKVVVKKGIKAGDLIKEICPTVGGKGGGRPDMAQGGGNRPERIPEAIETGKDWLACMIGKSNAP